VRRPSRAHASALQTAAAAARRTIDSSSSRSATRPPSGQPPPACCRRQCQWSCGRRRAQRRQQRLRPGRPSGGATGPRQPTPHARCVCVCGVGVRAAACAAHPAQNSTGACCGRARRSLTHVGALLRAPVLLLRRGCCAV
jgi:hypothetical protein